MPKKFPVKLQKLNSYYETKLGRAYLGDSINLLKLLPEKSVSLVVTSPPFALRRKKNYGNPEAEKYVEWFQPFAKEVYRVLKDNGSFVIECFVSEPVRHSRAKN